MHRSATGWGEEEKEEVMGRKKEIVKWKKDRLKDRDYASKQFDKLMVYLSSGALILSIGFTEKIIDPKVIEVKPLLILAWAFFASSLVTMLLSHKTSIYSMDAELDGETSSSDKWDCVTELFNWASTFSLLSGIIIFIVFVSINL